MNKAGGGEGIPVELFQILKDDAVEMLPPQYCGLENFRGCIVHGVAKSWTQVSEFHFHFHCDIEWFALEMNRDHSVIFEIASKYCILDSFVTMMATSQS